MKTKVAKWTFFGLLMFLWHPLMSQLFKEVGSYHDDRAVVQEFRKGVGRMNNFGYVDEYNKLVIPMKYNYAGDFRNGAAIVGIGNRKGIINKKGQVVLPIEYETIALDAQTGCYKLSKNGKNGRAGKDGKLLIPCTYDWVSTETGIVGGVAFFVAHWKDGDYDYGDLYDMQGNSLLPKGYVIPYEFNPVSWKNIAKEMHEPFLYHRKFQKNGFCIVEKDHRFGVFDPVARRLVLDAEYDWVVIFDDCFLTVKNGLCGLAKTDGTEIYPNSYKSIMGYDCFYVYNEKDEFAVYDAKKRAEVLPFGCKKVEDKIINYKNQYLLWDFQHSCKYDDNWYDTIIVVPMKRSTNGYVEEYGYVLKRNGKFGLKAMKEINYKNILQAVLPFEFDTMEYEDDFHVSWERSVDWWSNKAEKIPVIHIKKDGNWGLVYDYKPTRTVSDAKMQESGHFLIAQRNGKYGFYRPNGDVQFKYDSKPTSLNIDQWLVESKGKHGLVKYYNTLTGGGLSAAGDHVGILTSPSGVFVEQLSPVYDAIRSFGGIALTTKDGKNGFVWITNPQEGQTPIELPYQEVEYRGAQSVIVGKTNGKPKRSAIPLFAVMKNNKWGLIGINKDDSILVISKPKYDQIGEFERNGALVKKGNKTFYIDVDGKEVKDYYSSSRY